MSILVVGKFHGDTATFRQSLVERAGEYEKFMQMSQAGGAIHHRFGIGDGVVVLVDEWETAEQFEAFFSNPDLQAFIATIGADPGPPELTITEAVASPDQY
jgi:hypothetical protein